MSDEGVGEGAAALDPPKHPPPPPPRPPLPQADAAGALAAVKQAFGLDHHQQSVEGVRPQDWEQSIRVSGVGGGGAGGGRPGV